LVFVQPVVRGPILLVGSHIYPPRPFGPPLPKGEKDLSTPWRGKAHFHSEAILEMSQGWVQVMPAMVMMYLKMK